MNKSIRIMGIAAMVLLLAVSCKKEKQEESRRVTLTAGIESNTGKTYIYYNPNVEDTGPFTCWIKGDEIMVNGNRMYMVGEPEQSVDHPEWYHSATFQCDNWKGDVPGSKITLYAIFPATQQEPYTDNQGNECYKSRVTLPMEQTYIGDNDFMHNLPMGMSNKGLSINFHNLSNVYRLPVYAQNDITITKVVMRKNEVTNFNPIQVGIDQDQNPIYLTPDNLDIVGDIWYPHFGSETQNIEIIGGNSHEITLNCKTEDYPNGVTISKGSAAPTIFSFAAFPVQLTAGIEFDL